MKKILSVLKSGGMIVAPSDTVYGLLVDATNNSAVKKLIKFKSRPAGRPISIFVANLPMLKKYAEINLNQEKTLKELLPGPFTIILKSKHKVSQHLESENGTIGIRLPDYKYIQDLVDKFGRPVTATSANISGRSPHYEIKTLLSELSKEKRKLIDYIVDIGKLPRNKPSTVIDLTSTQLKIVRRGDIVFQNTKSFISEKPEQTKKIGQYLLKKFQPESTKKPLVFIIEGELGVGKTVLVKGMGEVLGIDNIISPSYVIYYEYGNFYHFDLYNISEKEEFKYLGIEKLLKPGKIFCFEWGEKTGDILKLLKQKAKIVYVKMKYISEKERKIEIRS